MFVMMFTKSRLRITKEIRKSSLLELYTFSKNQFLFNIMNYFSRNLDHLLIGKYISLKQLGYYDKAYTLSLYPNQILTSVITPVVQPVLSEYEEQKTVIKDTYVTLSKLLALMGMPLTVFLVLSAEEVILILFGSQWTGSIPTFQILALSIWIQMILSSTGSIFQSSNRTDLMLLSGILSTILNVASIVIGILFGKIEIVALGLVISFAINFIQCNYLLMKKVFQARQIEYYKILISPSIISLLVLISLVLIEYFLGNVSIWVTIIVKGFASLVMFLFGLKLTGNLSYLLKIFKRRGGGAG